MLLFHHFVMFWSICWKTYFVEVKEDIVAQRIVIPSTLILWCHNDNVVIPVAILGWFVALYVIIKSLVRSLVMPLLQNRLKKTRIFAVHDITLLFVFWKVNNVKSTNIFFADKISDFCNIMRTPTQFKLSYSNY